MIKMYFWIIALGVCLADQVSKFIIQQGMAEGQSFRVLGEFFRISFVYNENAAFGIPIQSAVPFLRPTLFYGLFMVLAIAVLISIYRKTPSHEKLLRTTLALILGGAAGNFIDRILLGRVVDFLDFDFFNIHVRPFHLVFFQFPGYDLDRWPTFNVADSAITCGIVLLLALSFLKPRPATGANPKEPGSESAPPAG